MAESVRTPTKPPQRGGHHASPVGRSDRANSRRTAPGRCEQSPWEEHVPAYSAGPVATPRRFDGCCIQRVARQIAGLPWTAVRAAESMAPPYAGTKGTRPS